MMHIRLRKIRTALKQVLKSRFNMIQSETKVFTCTKILLSCEKEFKLLILIVSVIEIRCAVNNWISLHIRKVPFSSMTYI